MIFLPHRYFGLKLFLQDNFDLKLVRAKLTCGFSCHTPRGPVSSSSPSDNQDERSNLIHREILQLVLLIAVAVAAFFVTRAIAANNRDMSVRDAAEWYQRGLGQLDAGHADDATDSFRRATVKHRNEKRYVLALARALASTRQYEAARSALLALRESAPEDPDINLQLARLAADRQDVTEALRYYHNALYAPWTTEQADTRRRVRLELIHFLLTHDQVNRALSETVALSTDLPDDAAAHVEVGQLLASAGDSNRALDQFQRALRLAPDNGDALAGAGQAAFQTGDYRLARTYLRKAPDDMDRVTETRELVDLVLSSDPLAARIGSSERRRRLLDSFSYADERLSSCIEQHPGGQPPADELAVRDEAQDFKIRLTPSILEQDMIESGVELIDRIEREVVQHCPPPALRDRALLLIGPHHGVDAR
jgi:tetratricopeptide (TPR) repeat protein